MESTARFGCVIMASGLGKRFGGNKLMAPFGGKPLICRSLDVTEGLFFRRIVVTRHEDVEALCQIRDVPVLRHQLPHRSDTVRLGLEALGDDLDGYLFLPGDQPLLSRESLQNLLVTTKESPDHIVRLCYGETPGSPVLFPRWAYPELMTLPEGKGGNVVVKNHPEQVCFVPARESYELLDVDCPEDLAALSACLK